MMKWGDFVGRPSGPARDLWIEIVDCKDYFRAGESGPARDLWIEIKQHV